MVSPFGLIVAWIAVGIAGSVGISFAMHQLHRSRNMKMNVFFGSIGAIAGGATIFLLFGSGPENVSASGLAAFITAMVVITTLQFVREQEQRDPSQKIFSS